jgi:CRISPR/Cas system-associated exonuclease Cas4 (RecB family)
MKLTSALFEAYLKCPTKCYLRSTGQAGSGNAYAEWVAEKADLSTVFISRVERGKESPSVDNLVKIAKALAVRVRDLADQF